MLCCLGFPTGRTLEMLRRTQPECIGHLESGCPRGAQATEQLALESSWFTGQLAHGMCATEEGTFQSRFGGSYVSGSGCHESLWLEYV